MIRLFIFNSARVIDAYLGTELSELLDPVIEGQDLCGTHECKVEGVEEEHEIFPLVVAQLDLCEVPVEDGGAGEVWGGLRYHGLGHLDVVAPGPGLGHRGATRAIVAGLRCEAHRNEDAQVQRGGDHGGSGNGGGLSQEIFQNRITKTHSEQPNVESEFMSQKVARSTFPELGRPVGLTAGLPRFGLVIPTINYQNRTRDRKRSNIWGCSHIRHIRYL